LVESESTAPVRQKIVPDGFPEIIFHMADGYRISITGKWEVQARSLFAGQIKKFFFLENTGRSSVFGVKLKPATPALLWNVEMSQFTDRVANLEDVQIANRQLLKDHIFAALSMDRRVEAVENFLFDAIEKKSQAMHPVEQALATIVRQHGILSIEQLAGEIGIGKRQLELYFKKYVGLSPKFYSRVMRFSKIFALVQEKEIDWSDIVHLSGYYDQAHFIKNFKAFTGEEPGRYGFDKKDFANFFMKKA
jgi:AraC-like DNA-binding protein